jgi:hypothetical protein
MELKNINFLFIVNHRVQKMFFMWQPEETIRWWLFTLDYYRRSNHKKQLESKKEKKYNEGADSSDQQNKNKP